MGTVRYLARPRLRAGWRGAVVLGLIAGLGLGVALGCLAGARRTGSSFDRFLAAHHPGNVSVSPDASLPPARRLAILESLRDEPGVTASGTAAWVFHVVPGESRDALVTLIAVDDGVGQDVLVPRVVDGRQADPGAVDEITVNEAAADALALEVGDTTDLAGVPGDEQDLFFSPEPVAEGVEPTPFTVVGIVRNPEDLQPEGASNRAYMTLAYWEATASELAHVGPDLTVELAPEHQAAFVAEATRLAGVDAVSTVDAEGSAVNDATAVQAKALTAFGAVLAVATLLLAGQGFVRQVLLGLGDDAALAAVGVGRRRRGMLYTVPSALSASVAGTAAAITAVATSPWFPFGLAGRAEPNSGLHVDVPIVVGGALLVVAALLVIGAASAWLAVRRSTRGADRPARVVGAWAAGLPLPIVIGSGFALRPGRGRTGVPVRTVLATGVVGLAVLVAAAGFSRSLDRLQSDPVRFGWNFDLVTGTSDDPDTFREMGAFIGSEPRIGDWTTASAVTLAVNDERLPVLGFRPVVGDALPVVVAGRLPHAPGEIAIGRDDLDGLGVGLGDTVDSDGTELRVVGISLLPGGTVDFPGGLGHGALMTLDGLRALRDAPRNVYLLRVADGLDRTKTIEDFTTTILGVYAATPGPDIDNLARVDALPLALAAALGLLALATLAHGLVMSVRRRRRDLAVLRVLGCGGRTVSSVVAWQATTVGIGALALGLPLGTILARAAWAAVADGLGVATDLAPPTLLGTAALVLATLAAVNLIALLPGLWARRVRPAVALRTE